MFTHLSTLLPDTQEVTAKKPHEWKHADQILAEAEAFQEYPKLCQKPPVGQTSNIHLWTPKPSTILDIPGHKETYSDSEDDQLFPHLRKSNHKPKNQLSAISSVK